MTVKDLEGLFNYAYWANRRLFTVIAQLTPEQFTHPVAGSYGSIRNTLVHILSAEWGWLERCGGPARGPRLNPADYPTIESVVETWTKVERYVREFLSKQPDADLARIIEFSFDGTTKHAMALGDMMQHAAIHGVHHRGQVALLLRMLGCTPGDFDVLFYNAERRAAASV